MSHNTNGHIALLIMFFFPLALSRQPHEAIKTARVELLIFSALTEKLQYSKVGSERFK